VACAACGCCSHCICSELLRQVALPSNGTACLACDVRHTTLVRPVRTCPALHRTEYSCYYKGSAAHIRVGLLASWRARVSAAPVSLSHVCMVYVSDCQARMAWQICSLTDVFVHRMSLTQRRWLCARWLWRAQCGRHMSMRKEQRRKTAEIAASATRASKS
jgi:hypothetical protein